MVDPMAGTAKASPHLPLPLFLSHTSLTPLSPTCTSIPTSTYIHTHAYTVSLGKLEGAP